MLQQKVMNDMQGNMTRSIYINLSKAFATYVKHIIFAVNHTNKQEYATF
jgi:hypothetical protein